MEIIYASFELKIVFDNNNKGEKNFLPEFGFSVLIYNFYTENYLLFDTGSNGEILIHNIEQFNVNISEIKKIIISHNHHEHSMGLAEIYKINPDIEIYVPIENLILFKRKYPKSKVIGVSDLTEIEHNIYSTGQLGTYLKEQALFLKSQDNKLIVIVGCCHPGLDEIISRAKAMKDSKGIKAIIGGFHGFRNFNCLEGIDFIGPCHCTKHLDLLENRFSERFNRIYVGSSFYF